VCQWKNFENRPVLDYLFEVMPKTLQAHFPGHGVGLYVNMEVATSKYSKWSIYQDQYRLCKTTTKRAEQVENVHDLYAVSVDNAWETKWRIDEWRETINPSQAAQ